MQSVFANNSKSPNFESNPPILSYDVVVFKGDMYTFR